MTFALIVQLLLLPVLLVLSGFFSGSETALFSLSAHQRALFRRSDTLVGAAITTLLSETRGLLITLLLANMTINVLFFVVSSVLLIQLNRLEWAGAVVMSVASVTPLLAIILLGEVLPKLLAARLTVTWARLLALPLYLTHRVLFPVRFFAEVAVITPLARLIAPRRTVPKLSEEELESLLTLSQRQGVIDPDEERLLQQVLELSQIKVRNLMVPRVDIKAFNLDRDPAELIEMARAYQLNHIPVYRGSLDNIVGVVYERQVLLNEPRDRQSLYNLIRQAKFVPEQQRVDQLLVELRKRGTTFAIVVDEYGGTSGLVTLEDVVEHMVGEIPGPFESGDQPEVENIGPFRWRVAGSLSVHEWAEFFGRNPAIEGIATLEAVRTVAGLVMARLGRVPAPGDRVRLGDVRITVERVENRRVQTVLIELRARGAGRNADETPQRPETGPSDVGPSETKPK